MNLLSSTTVFSFYTLISRVLGYIRDILIAFFMGTSILADAFFVAFRIPNTFRRLFAEGTFNAAFIPSYTNEKINSKDKGKIFADEVFSILTIALLFLVLLIEIFTPYFVFLIAPGFYSEIEKFEIAVELTRITFPFLLFVSLSSFFSGILNSNNKFAAAAAAPIILNIILILFLLISYFYNLNFARSLSIGVTLSGILQLIFLIYFTKKYYKPNFIFNLKVSQKIKLFLRKLLPSIFSSGVTQINILIGTIIASFQTSAVSYLYFADRIYQINLAIAGIAVSTVSLPVLSKALKLKDHSKVDNIQNKSLELSLLLSLPASFGIIISAEYIVNALFGYGSFNESDVRSTALALKFFGYGIPAFAILKIFSNMFFARDNTKTPFYVSSIIVILNTSISLFFFRELGFVIIPISTSISSWFGVIIYILLLKNRKFFKFEKKTIYNILKIFFSTILMSILLLFLTDYFNDKLDYSQNFKFFYLLLVITIVAIVYFISCYLLGVLNFKRFKTI